MNRFKSYGFWTALSGAVVVLLNAIGDCFGFSINNELVSGLIMAVAGVLVVFGVVSMPKNEQNDKNNENVDVENSSSDDTLEDKDTNEEDNKQE